MNTEQTSENIFTYIKRHYGETILAKIRKLEETMINYSSYTNHLRFYILSKPIFSPIVLTSQITSTLPNKDIIAIIEHAVKDLQKEEGDPIHGKISLRLQNSKPPNDNLSKDEHKSLKELQSDTLIAVLPIDKGRSTVVLNCEDYFKNT